MKTSQDLPLVSVVVLSYNSSSTILETLDSVLYQTYSNIELIIADDCSTDNTSVIVEKWIHNNPLLHSCFLKSEFNKGISANANLGVSHCKGSWIKLIAADDIMLETCIEDNINYVTQNLDSKIVFSKLICFGEEQYKLRIQEIQNGFRWDYWKLSPKQQYMLLLQGNFLTAPSAFISKQLWIDLDGFDESIPFVEDWPFYIKAMKSGVKFSYLDKITVKYRIHNSFSENGNVLYIRNKQMAKLYAHKCQKQLSILFRLYCHLSNKINSRFLRFVCLGWNPYYWHVKYLLYCLNEK